MQDVKTGFVINGSIVGNAEGATVKLQRASLDETELVDVDSTIVKNGAYQLRGRLDMPEFCTIIIDSDPSNPDQQKLYTKVYVERLYVENSIINVKHKLATMGHYFSAADSIVYPSVIEGCKTQDDYNVFLKKTENVRKQMSVNNAQASDNYFAALLDGKQVVDIGIKLGGEQHRLDSIYKRELMDYIKNNAASVIAFDQFRYMVLSPIVPMSSADINGLQTVLAPQWQNNPRWKVIQPQMTNFKRVSCGMPYVNVNVLTRQGKLAKLSALMPKGQYVMLEFWASWCGPCRAEIPHLKQVLKKFPKFKIVSVSIDDNKKEWKKAIAEEKPMWTQVCLPKGMKDVAMDKYNVQGVPHCLLIDKKGRIVEIDTRGPKLDYLLSRIFKNTNP
jgi:thiol-disulfide isomerase/thioredoxin